MEDAGDSRVHPEQNRAGELQVAPPMLMEFDDLDAVVVRGREMNRFRAREVFVSYDLVGVLFIPFQ